MAEEEKSQQKLVKPYTVIASGMAAMVAALFTSKLGVAGTLIGTALTAMTITLGSAILSAQLERASTKVSALPTNVRGRLSTQQIRIPGKQSPEPEPSARPKAGSEREGLLSRLRAIPNYLKNLPSARRRSILLTGILAGLVATIIGLGGVTGIEFASGKNLSCQLWTECPTTTTGAPTGSSGGSGLSILGGSSYSNPPAAPGQQQPAQPDQQVPQQQRPADPAQPAPNDGAGQPPDQQQGADPAQPKADPNSEEPATPGR